MEHLSVFITPRPKWNALFKAMTLVFHLFGAQMTSIKFRATCTAAFGSHAGRQKRCVHYSLVMLMPRTLFFCCCVLAGQLAVGTCEIVMLNRDSSIPRRTIARQTARCACRRGQIAGTTRARPACVDGKNLLAGSSNWWKKNYIHLYWYWI